MASAARASQAAAADPPRADAHRRRARSMRDERIEVLNPYTDEVVGTVPRAHARRRCAEAFETAARYKPKLTRYERQKILLRDGRDARRAPRGDRRPHHRRVRPVHEGFALRGRPRLRRLHARRPAGDPATTARSSPATSPRTARRGASTPRASRCWAICAITPFNHPLNMVAHKIAPAIATNNRVVLKPTELTPLTALLLADILYEAGLPPRDAVGRDRRARRDRRRA